MSKSLDAVLGTERFLVEDGESLEHTEWGMTSSGL